MRHGKHALLGLAIALTVGLGFVAASPALAQDQHGGMGGPEDMFQMMDTAKKGYLTKEDFAPHGMTGDFDRCDANHDGQVTPEEFKACMTPQSSGS